MLKNNVFAFLFLICLATNAQNIDLPGDIRQHNITNFSSSLLHPAYSLDTNSKQNLDLWTRWQWQTIDDNPTSVFVNYNRKLGDSFSIGAGYLQNNTEVFINTGGVVNFATNLNLSSDITLGVGLNVFGYKQELVNNIFVFDPQIQLSQFGNGDSFIMQFAPGFNLQIDNFSIGFVAENIFDFDFTTKERATEADDRVYLGLASYRIPISLFNFDEEAYLRPAVYYKTVPNQESQIGVSSILNTNKFWVQAGYNTFYGVSGGAGVTLFKHLSIGLVAEFGSSEDLNGIDPSFEFVTSYGFGKKQPKNGASKKKNLQKKLDKKEALAAKNLAKENARKNKEEAGLLVASKKASLKRQRDSLKTLKRNRKLEAEENFVASKKTLSKQELQKRKKDSIERKKLEDALAFSKRLREKNKKDATESEPLVIEKTTKKEVVVVQKEEKYEEVAKEGTLEPGYYLIANIFGTKKYLQLFMKDVRKKGLHPEYFYRTKNRFNYVYLGKYTTIKDARAARDSQLDGKYTSKLWIFRVTGE